MSDDLPPLTAQRFIRCILFFYENEPDDTTLSIGHWDTPEPDPQKMTRYTLPQFQASMSIKVGDLKKMLDDA